MPSARRFNRHIKNKKKTPRLLFGVFAMFVVLFVTAYFLSTKSFWKQQNKLSIVLNSQYGVTVVTLDPIEHDLTKILIPQTVQVDSARGFGKWKLGSIWQLGENENLEGKLLQETLVKNFGFPVHFWANAEDDIFLKNGVGSVFAFFFKQMKTDLGIVDRIKITLFLVNLKETDIKTIELEGSGYLKKAKLPGGEEGYTVSGLPPAGLALVFSDSETSKKKLRVQVTNRSEISFSNTIFPVVDFLGGKVVSELNQDSSELDCVVSTLERQFGENLSQILGCDFRSIQAPGNVDIEIQVGERFGERY